MLRWQAQDSVQKIDHDCECDCSVGFVLASITHIYSHEVSYAVVCLRLLSTFPPKTHIEGAVRGQKSYDRRILHLLPTTVHAAPFALLSCYTLIN